MLDIETFESIDGKAIKVPTVDRSSGLGELAKAHPAASLINPAWKCPKCDHRNPVTAPFCEKCPE
jgi:hypothetical protein